MLGDLLGNSYFVERMGARNDGAWKRFVLALKAADMGKAAGVSKETQKYLSGLYKSYVKAVDAAGSGVKVSSMVDDEEKEKAVNAEKGVDITENERYNKVRDKRPKRKKGLYYSQYESLVMQWAFSSTTKPGDVNVFYNPQTNTWNKIVIVDTEDRYGTRLSIKDTTENAEAIRKLREEVYNEDYREEQGAGESVYANYEGYWYLRGMHGDDNLNVENPSSNGRTREIHREEPEGERTRGSRKGAEDNRPGRSSNNVKSDERKSKQSQTKKVIDLSNDDRLSALVEGVHGSQRYNIIREYILAELADQPIRLSDGKMAVVDKRDAQHIARNAGNEKATQISHIKEIVESAVLIAEEESTKENKFSHFWYYEAHALYEGELVSLYVNVGQTRNDKSYHVYDLTKKIRDTAHRVNDVGRPVGYALENDISNKSISQNSEKSTENEKKVSDERKSKKIYRRAETALAEFGATSDFSQAGLESDAKTKKDEKGCLP